MILIIIGIKSKSNPAGFKTIKDNIDIMISKGLIKKRETTK